MKVAVAWRSPPLEKVAAAEEDAVAEKGWARLGLGFRKNKLGFCLLRLNNTPQKRFEAHKKRTPQLDEAYASTSAYKAVIKLRLIWHPSRSLTPSAFVCDALSLPAKSTKFCNISTDN
nr:hypothetical protein Itr_chr09CG10140 [Ipomoea trifida]